MEVGCVSEGVVFVVKWSGVEYNRIEAAFF